MKRATRVSRLFLFSLQTYRIRVPRSREGFAGAGLGDCLQLRVWLCLFDTIRHPPIPQFSDYFVDQAILPAEWEPSSRRLLHRFGFRDKK